MSQVTVSAMSLGYGLFFTFKGPFIQSANPELELYENGTAGDLPRELLSTESGFLRKNRNPFCIKTQSFVNVNYFKAKIINYQHGLPVTANSPYCKSCSLFEILISISFENI